MEFLRRQECQQIMMTEERLKENHEKSSRRANKVERVRLHRG